MLLGLLLALVLILLGLYLSARARASAQAGPALGAAAPAPGPDREPPAGAGHPGVDARRLEGPMVPDPTPSPASDPTGRSPINLSALNRLRAVDHDDNAHVLPALIDAFCRAGPDQLDALHAALAQADPIPALTTLGLFRTSARLLGARDLEALAGRLQSTLEARDTAAAKTILQAMRVEFGAVTVALDDFAALITPAPAAGAQRTPPPAPKPGRLPYLPGLDGLRALAVIAVVLYHAGIDFLPAGFLGVEIFFVISGYLITALLLAERATGAGVSLKRFWIRRARRLLPALFFLLAGVLVYFALFLPGEVASIRGEALAAFAYVSNWGFIAEDASYFEQVGRPSPLLHLWSLAIEEQFYLLWPLIFVGLTWLGGRRLLFPAIVLGAIGSTWLMAALYQPFDDVSRIYYGTDTRAAGLLIGAALAVVWRAGALPAPRRRLSIWLLRARGLGPILRWSLDAAGLAALGGLVYIVVTFSEFQPSLYQGGFALVSILTAIVIAATVAPGGTLGRVMGVAPLRWIGLRSYAIYLWHWPIFVVTRPDLDVSMGDTELLLMRLALTLLFAEISYRFVEMPVRRGALGRLWARLRAQDRPRWRRELQRGAVAFPPLAGGVALAFVVAVAQPAEPPSFLPADRVSTVAASAISATIVQDPPSVQTPARPQRPATTIAADPAAAVFFADGSLTATPASSTSERLGLASVRTVGAPPGVGITDPAAGSISTRFGVGLTIAPAARATDVILQPATAAVDLSEASPGLDLPDAEVELGRLLISTPVLREPPPPPPPAFTAIGDSVMLGAASQLQEVFGGIGIDAEVSRHLDPAIELIRDFRDAGVLGETVILHLGNNGPIYPEQLQELMELLDAHTVVFVNLRVPRQWQDWNNQVLRESVAQYSNATLIDWYSASDNKPDMFWGDGYHLRPDGARYYANLIATAVRG